MPDAFDHCEQLVREGDKDRFLATLFAPQKYRRPLYALYAFNIEIKSIRERARESLPGEIRLQWWRDVLNGIERGEVEANPVASALRETIVRYGLPPKAILGLIDAHAFDLYDDPMATLDQFESYATKTSGVVFECAARILAGKPNDRLVEIAADAGRAETVATILAKFPRHSARHQLYVPAEMLRECGARTEDIFAQQTTDEVRKTLAVMREWGRRYRLVAMSKLSKVTPAILPAFLPLAPLLPFFLKMERSSYDPFRPPVLSAWRRQWAIWRAAKRWPFVRAE